MCDWIENNCSYAIIGCETGESGTYHWQGYGELSKQLAFTTVAKAAKWHIEKRRGNAKQARDYCKKDGVWVEHGKMSEQGRRTDIEDLKKLAREEGLAAVADACLSWSQYKLCEVYMNYQGCARNPDEEVSVIYITGESGAGKSKLAYEMLNGKAFYVKDETQWWTGYNGEKYVLMDDFRDSWMTHNQFIKLTDRYPHRVKVHGNIVQMRATTFVITSVIPPDQLYAHCSDEPRMQVSRRITKIIQVCAPPPASAAASSESTQYSEVGVILGPTSSEQNVCTELNDEDYIM